MIGRNGERGSGISALAARHDDDDDDDDQNPISTNRSRFSSALCYIKIWK